MQSGQLISEIHHNSETNKIELDHYMDMLSDAVLIVKIIKLFIIIELRVIYLTIMEMKV